jgi:hypothetical protein
MGVEKRPSPEGHKGVRENEMLRVSMMKRLMVRALEKKGSVPSRVESMRLTNAGSPLGKPEPSPGILGHSDGLISSGFFGVDFAATVWHGPGVCVVRTRVYSDRCLVLPHIEFADDSGNGFVSDS